VHDSGGERALAADVADGLQLPFAEIAPVTSARLAAVLDEGMAPANPLDVWGTGAETEALVSECLEALAADEAVDVTALAVDLVEEYDGDDSYPSAAIRAHGRTEVPLVVLNSVTSAIDQRWAGTLRAAGVPVLEGLDSGLRALRHLLDAASPPELPQPHTVDVERRDRWASRLETLRRRGENLSGPEAFELLADYGVDVARPAEVGTETSVLRAAGRVGYPVVLKTAAPGVDHKVDVAGVVTGLADPAALAAAYAEMRTRLGPRVVVQPMVGPGTELALGIAHDPHLGPLVLLAAGGSLVELVAERVVALPPLTSPRAEELLDRVPLVEQLMAGVRGRLPVDRSAVVRAWVGVAELACELGGLVEALDVNPLICDEKGAVAVDVLVVPAR
jgi:acyl-CoA synthetase (NDP forming)